MSMNWDDFMEYPKQEIDTTCIEASTKNLTTKQLLSMAVNYDGKQVFKLLCAMIVKRIKPL